MIQGSIVSTSHTLKTETAPNSTDRDSLSNPPTGGILHVLFRDHAPVVRASRAFIAASRIRTTNVWPGLHKIDAYYMTARGGSLRTLMDLVLL